MKAGEASPAEPSPKGGVSAASRSAKAEASPAGTSGPTAFERLEQAAQSRPGNARARRLLALAYAQEGRAEEALKLWEASPAPDDEFGGFVRAYLLHATGKDAAALADLDRTRETWLRAAARGGGEAAVPARRDLLALYVAGGRAAEAERLLADLRGAQDGFTDALRLETRRSQGDARARRLLALARLQEGPAEDALKLWDASPAPDDEFGEFARAYLEHAAGKHAAALADLDRTRESWLRAAARGGGEAAVAARRALLALYVTGGRPAEAERLLADLRESKDEATDLFRIALQKALGDPEGAAAAAEALAQRWHAAQPLALRGLAFCRRIEQFRLYEPYEPDAAFSPGDSPLLYVEVEAATQEPKGLDKRRVALEYQLRLLDERGKAVPTPDWEGYKRRLDHEYHGAIRDLVLPLCITLPPTLSGGRYRLHLRVDDKLVKNRSAEAEVEFQVREAGK